ncbi:hypothetical protein BDW68DRAFT_148739 [Aspergillus falconensis]
MFLKSGYDPPPEAGMSQVFVTAAEPGPECSRTAATAVHDTFPTYHMIICKYCTHVAYAVWASTELYRTGALRY